MSDLVIRDCKHSTCKAKIVFVLTSKGHQMPVDLATLKCAACPHVWGSHAKGYCGEGKPNPADGQVCPCTAFRLAQVFDGKLMVSHFATCANAKAFRRPHEGQRNQSR